MRVQLAIAFAHQRHRRRSTLVSLMGIMFGVAFFLAVSALMRGSEEDFLKLLVDNSPTSRCRTSSARRADSRPNCAGRSRQWQSATSIPGRNVRHPQLPQ